MKKRRIFFKAAFSSKEENRHEIYRYCKLDELGRVVLPIELRRTMDLNIHDTVEIFVEDDKIILKKYHPACIFCGDARDVTTFKGKLVCVNCLRELQGR